MGAKVKAFLRCILGASLNKPELKAGHHHRAKTTVEVCEAEEVLQLMYS